MKPNIQNHRLDEDVFPTHDSPNALRGFEILQSALSGIGDVDLVGAENAKEVLVNLLDEPLPDQLRMELVNLINQLKVLTKTVFDVRSSSNRVINLYEKEKTHRDRPIVPGKERPPVIKKLRPKIPQ